MSTEYKRNHYVPVWYQNRFLDPGSRDAVLFYLNLKPDTFTDPRGVTHTKRSLRPIGPKQCFYEEDLYTSFFRDSDLTEIEQEFFGGIDSNGRKSVDFFSKFDHDRSGAHDHFNSFLLYLSTQKLRTPKGLGWLKEHAKARTQNELLQRMLDFRNLYQAAWVECTWQIADASGSNTKFLVSDHPVTVYNRRFGPRNDRCRGFEDPHVCQNATHTMFPLSPDKILILTNLSWVRNPYQKPGGLRPNPTLFRDAVFHFEEIQTHRFLSESEVLEMNFIIKSRANRFIAAAKEEWLYPERSVSKSDWARFGSGYLLMPDPRSVSLRGQMLIGYKNGRAEGFDEYGRKPWNQGYDDQSARDAESRTLHKFQGEFARLFGPVRRGRSMEFGELSPEKDGESSHRYHLSREKR